MAEVNVALIGYKFMGEGALERLSAGQAVFPGEARAAPQGDLRA